MGALLPSRSSSSETLRQTESFRTAASQLVSQAKTLSKPSEDEYNSEGRSQAKTLSTEKARLYQQANERNRQAAQLFFEHFKRDRAKDVIHLCVAEALEYLQTKTDLCRSEKVQQLTVITGIGKSSPDNIAKIKPEGDKIRSPAWLENENTHRCAIQ